MLHDHIYTERPQQAELVRRRKGDGRLAGGMGRGEEGSWERRRGGPGFLLRGTRTLRDRTAGTATWLWDYTANRPTAHGKRAKFTYVHYTSTELLFFKKLLSQEFNQMTYFKFYSKL